MIIKKINNSSTDVKVNKNIFSTYRVVSPKLEKILYNILPVLDHGFVRVIDYMGNDISIVQAARVSYGIGTKKFNKDRGLIRYLMRHRHTTPFEMCEIKYHIKLPIFIARQWIRHRTANVNEYSARYSILGKDFYLPEISQIKTQSNINNQGRGDSISVEQSKKILEILKKDSEVCYDNYKYMLNENCHNKFPASLSRELARMNLTLNYYTEWYWKIDLHNLLHFLMLRLDSHAQYEIRKYAEVILETIKLWCPITYEAFEDYILASKVLSKKELKVIQQLIAGEKVTQNNSGLNIREWKELFIYIKNIDISV